MNPNIVGLVLTLISELPRITETAQKVIESLRQTELTPDEIAKLEALEAESLREWAADLEEDRPIAGVPGAE